MNFTRVILAHICAVFTASAVIMAGMGLVDAGLVGLVERFAGWVAGFPIFAGLSVLSLPLGLTVRAVVGRFATNPERAAIATGVMVGLALIPVLHPAMMPPIALLTYPLQLLVIHGVAGAIGGWLWFAIEQPSRRLAE